MYSSTWPRCRGSRATGRGITAATETRSRTEKTSFRGDSSCIRIVSRVRPCHGRRITTGIRKHGYTIAKTALPCRINLCASWPSMWCRPCHGRRIATGYGKHIRIRKRFVCGRNNRVFQYPWPFFLWCRPCHDDADHNSTENTDITDRENVVCGRINCICTPGLLFCVVRATDDADHHGNGALDLETVSRLWRNNPCIPYRGLCRCRPWPTTTRYHCVAIRE